MNRNMCNSMLGELLCQWSGDGGKKVRFCQLKGGPCEGPSCLAWTPVVTFCRTLCPKRADCRGRLSDLADTLPRPASDFDGFGFCLVCLGEELQKRRARRACFPVRRTRRPAGRGRLSAPRS